MKLYRKPFTHKGSYSKDPADGVAHVTSFGSKSDGYPEVALCFTASSAGGGGWGNPRTQMALVVEESDISALMSKLLEKHSRATWAAFTDCFRGRPAAIEDLIKLLIDEHPKLTWKAVSASVETKLAK